MSTQREGSRLAAAAVWAACLIGSALFAVAGIAAAVWVIVAAITRAL